MNSAKPGMRKFPQSKQKRGPHRYQTVRALPLPLTHNLSVHLPFAFLKPLDQDNHSVAHHKVGVLVLIGVAAHTDSAIGQVAKYPTAIFPSNSGIAAAADRVALFRAIKGIGLGSLHRDLEVILLRIEAGYNAVQFLARVVLLP